MMFSPSNQKNSKRKPRYQSKLLTTVLLLTSVGLSAHANTPVTDIQINSLISQAIQSHPLVGSARAEQQATVEGVNAAKLNMMPEPSATTSYNTDNNIVSEVGIRQPLWTGGRLTANVNQAIFDDKAAIEYIYEQQNQVAKTTIEAWQTYITAVAQQRVYLENLDQLNDFESMMQRRVKQGVSAPIELDLVTNRILQEQNAYEAAVEQQQIAASRLEQIIGRPISDGSAYNVPQLKLLVDQAKTASANFQKLAFNDASFYNPAVVRGYFQAESAKQEVKAQSASKYPTVFAEYRHSYDHDTNEDDGRFYVGLNYQPGAGLSNFALTRASEARVNSLLQNQEASRREVMENIQVEYQRFTSAKSRESSLIAAVAGAQIVVNSYRRQFIAGRKTWLEVLNAVRELSDYQIQLVQTRSNILGSFYNLQVDFGLMPWQTFAHNREPVKPFHALDPVKDWMQNHQNTVNKNSQDFGYGQSNVFLESSEDSYIPISLPASAQQKLDNGEVIMINDNQIISNDNEASTDDTANHTVNNQN